MPRAEGIPVISMLPGGVDAGLSCAIDATARRVAQAIAEPIEFRLVMMAKTSQRLDGKRTEITTFAELLLGGRRFGRKLNVFADLMLVVVEVRPLALLRRLEHHTIRSASHAKETEDRNGDNGQNPHTWPM